MQDLVLSKRASIWWVKFYSCFNQNHWSQGGNLCGILEPEELVTLIFSPSGYCSF